MSGVLDLADAFIDKIPVVGSFLGILKQHPVLAAIGVGVIVGFMGMHMGDNPLEAGINAILAATLVAQGHPLEGVAGGLGLDMLGKKHGFLDLMGEGVAASVVGLNWLTGGSKPAPNPAEAPSH